MRAELGAAALANPIHRVLQVVEQRFNGLAVNRHVLLQRSAIGGHTIDTTVPVVALRIANVVLHMADDHIGPI